MKVSAKESAPKLQLQHALIGLRDDRTCDSEGSPVSSELELHHATSSALRRVLGTLYCHNDFLACDLT